MKVGYISPMSIAAVNGGIRTQASFTIENIRKLGVEPHMLSPWDYIEQMELDLVHVFGASIENIGITDQLTALNIPFVLSPVFFSNRGAKFIKKAIKFQRLIPFLKSGIHSDFSIKAKICSQAGLILPNTSAEADLIEKGFSIAKDKIHVIPNGVDKRFAESADSLFEQEYGIRDFILFTGQAGAPRKNVLSLLKIAPQIEAPIVIIGSLFNDEYGDQCRKLAENSANITLIKTLEHNSPLLASAYAACKVFVLPSYYETPGIAALEAGLSGAHIVITERGGTKEYFNGFAEFIDPDSTRSLLAGIQNALKRESDDQLKNHILANYTWDKVAEITFRQYNKLLK